MDTIGFIGLGLIGGSIARTIRRVHPDTRILAANRSLAPLQKAKEEGVIDQIVDTDDPALLSCDYLFLCAPVEVNLAQMERIRDAREEGKLSEKTILTDVGSVKAQIHQKVEELGLGDCFIGGHPMAGSEKTGYENSTDRLLENAYYILTPGTGVDAAAISRFTGFIAGLGAIPLTLSCQEHDYVTAGVSHLPHLIASSSPVMWEQIVTENHQNILSVLDAYIHSLAELRKELDASHFGYIYEMFDSSKEYRDSIDVVDRGELKEAYALYVDLADEPGGIAAITTTLAMVGINLRNLAIIHNREFDEGVLKIEFYDRDSLERSTALLKKRNYQVHERSR